jgi:hypothetical protein
MDKRTLRQMQMIGSDYFALCGEAAAVVWLRSRRLLGGGPEALAEAELMVSEKIAAQQELALRLAGGKLGTNPLAVTASATRYMLKGVRANRRRLSRR